MIARGAFHPYQKKLSTKNKPIPEIIPFTPSTNQLFVIASPRTTTNQPTFAALYALRFSREDQ